MNERTPSLTRLLSQLRGLVSIADTEVTRRDLDCPRHSEVQLELDFNELKRKGPKWNPSWSAFPFGS
jgi:hypothetical protein